MRALKLLSLLLLFCGIPLAAQAVDFPAQVETTTPAYNAKEKHPITMDADGNILVKIGGAPSGGFGLATAAAPSLIEGADASFSFDLSGNARVTLGTLISGEDQANNLLMVNGGAVKVFTVMTGVTTNTTSAAVTIVSGGKTPIAQVVGTGAVTATIDLYGDNDSDAANGLALCTITLSGTTKAVGGCDGAKQITRDFAYYYAITTSVTGTGATVGFTVATGIAGYTGNISNINGATPLMGAGNTGTGSIRATEATDSQLSAGVGATGDAAVAAGATGSLNAKIRQLSNLTLDPCRSVATVSFPISISTVATTQLVAASASNKLYVCSLHLITAAANNVALVEDATSACASPDAGMAGGVTAATGWNLAANGGLVMGTGNGTMAKTASTNVYVCLITSAATQLSGTLVYALAP